MRSAGRSVLASEAHGAIWKKSAFCPCERRREVIMKKKCGWGHLLGHRKRDERMKKPPPVPCHGAFENPHVLVGASGTGFGSHGRTARAVGGHASAVSSVGPQRVLHRFVKSNAR